MASGNLVPLFNRESPGNHPPGPVQAAITLAAETQELSVRTRPPCHPAMVFWEFPRAKAITLKSVEPLT